MTSDLLLPLFPLEVVLLPHGRLPLHIFEERYKLMIGEALEPRSEFGVVLAKENSLANIGCTAIVERVARRYPDGRLDILAQGQRRFEILFLDEQKPYLRAGVHFFDDEAGDPPAPRDLQRMAGLIEQASPLLPASGGEPPESGKPLGSFEVAGLLPLELDVKQRLLNMRSETERVTTLIEYLEKLLPRLDKTRRVEKLARGNGKGR